MTIKFRLIVISIIVLIAIVMLRNIFTSYKSHRVGDMSIGRIGHSMTLLPNGKVLVTGGQTDSEKGCCTPVKTAEIFDPKTETFHRIGDSKGIHLSGEAFLLKNGKVFLPGDQHSPSELFDPTHNTFELSGQMNEPRTRYSTIQLPNKQILIVGGQVNLKNGFKSYYVKGIEVYNPSKNKFYKIGNLVRAALYNYIIISTPLDRILNVSTFGKNQCESFSLKTHRSTIISCDKINLKTLSQPVKNINKIFYFGGIEKNSFNHSRYIDVLDTNTLSFSTTGKMKVGRYGHQVTLLNGNKILISGGKENLFSLNSFEIYNVDQSKVTDVGKMISKRSSHTALHLGENKVLLSGGIGRVDRRILNTSEIITY